MPVNWVDHDSQLGYHVSKTGVGPYNPEKDFVVQVILPVGALHVVSARDHVLYPSCALLGGRRIKG